MLWRLTPRVDRLWSMAEVAGGRIPATPRADERPIEADNKAVVILDALH